MLQAEAEEKEKIEQAKREVLLAQSGGGAFPALGGGRTAASTTASSANARKVLTLGGAGTKLSASKITTYTKKKIAEGVMPPKSEPNAPRVIHVSRPPAEPLSEREANALWQSDEVWRSSLGRKFAKKEGVLVPTAMYVPVKEMRDVDGEDGGKKRRKKKGKGVDGAVVPGAG